MGLTAVLTPNTIAMPPAGLSNVVSMRIVVVLPAPFGPRSPNVSPAEICRLTRSTATCCPKR